jgi:hypothetical protein
MPSIEPCRVTSLRPHNSHRVSFDDDDNGCEVEEGEADNGACGREEGQWGGWSERGQGQGTSGAGGGAMGSMGPPRGAHHLPIILPVDHLCMWASAAGSHSNRTGSWYTILVLCVSKARG